MENKFEIGKWYKFVNKSKASPFPENWYLEVTRENIDYIASKRHNGLGNTLSGYIYSKLNDKTYKNYWYWDCKLLKGYDKITLEQFKEYVVKDVTIKEVESEIPEYVECVKSWAGNGQKSTVGKIYDTSIKPYFSNYNWKDVLESSTYFKPSTKEAFDAQNKPKEQSIEEILEICKKKYPIGTEVKSVFGKQGIIEKNYHIFDFNNVYVSTNKGDLILYEGKTNKYAEIISLPEPTKYPDITFNDFGVHIHKGNYQGGADFAEQALKGMWGKKIRPLTPKECFKSNDLEFQYPVINVRNKKKSKLIIINQ